MAEKLLALMERVSLKIQQLASKPNVCLTWASANRHRIAVILKTSFAWMDIAWVLLKRRFLSLLTLFQRTVQNNVTHAKRMQIVALKLNIHAFRISASRTPDRIVMHPMKMTS